MLSPIALLSGQNNPTNTDSISKKKPTTQKIDDEIIYQANDSIVFLGTGKAYLYGQGDVTYKSINLKADFIKMNMDSSTISATGKMNDSGQLEGLPVFKDGDAEYNSKELSYNFNTKKGFIRQAVTQQGEGYVLSDKTKITEGETLCIQDGKYTTCSDHDHPHFYLHLTKAKIKPKDYIVTGPAYLVLLDVPLPVALPFGFFPFTEEYSSGIIVPTYGDEFTRGFYLRNGGYYFAFNDYFDLALTGEIYTKGTWGISAASSYVKRYKFRGNININYREDVMGEKDLPDYSIGKNLKISWSHTQDSKANPYQTFSANVNFSTSGYETNNINSYYNSELLSQNTKSSSISFTQRFPESPFSISLNVLATQRTKDSVINLSLPDITVNMSRIYPFKRKKAIGKELWYEKIALSYSGQISNSIETKESKLLTSSFTRDWKNAANHYIPISASFNLFRYISVTPSANYQERWYLKSIKKDWDNDNQTLTIDTVSGFYRVYDFNMGINAQTKLYGFYTPIRAIFGDKIDRIRHVITPSVGFSYRPDFGNPFWNYWDTYNKNGSEVVYSRFENALYGTPSRGESGSINFSLANNLEMKVKEKMDTVTNEPIYKKISLIDNFSFSGSYNLAADSMNWSNISANIRIKIFKDFNINLSGSFEMYKYALNTSGNPVRVNTLRWSAGELPRLIGTGTSFGYTLNNATFKKKDSDKKPNDSADKKDQEKNKEDIDGYQKLDIPWNLRFDYSVRYGNSTFNKDKLEFDRIFTHNLNMSGNISVTKKWKINFSAAYDLNANEITYSQIGISRDLHCWTMSARVVPFGPYKSYDFSIRVNSSLLSDLKYEKMSNYTQEINWY
jgi:lipopolysaccharide assembly outer membrane protein LptD (OstA)